MGDEAVGLLVLLAVVGVFADVPKPLGIQKQISEAPYVSRFALCTVLGPFLLLIVVSCVWTVSTWSV